MNCCSNPFIKCSTHSLAAGATAATPRPLSTRRPTAYSKQQITSSKWQQLRRRRCCCCCRRRCGNKRTTCQSTYDKTKTMTIKTNCRRRQMETETEQLESAWVTRAVSRMGMELGLWQCRQSHSPRVRAAVFDADADADGEAIRQVKWEARLGMGCSRAMSQVGAIWCAGNVSSCHRNCRKVGFAMCHCGGQARYPDTQPG